MNHNVEENPGTTPRSPLIQRIERVLWQVDTFWVFIYFIAECVVGEPVGEGEEYRGQSGADVHASALTFHESPGAFEYGDGRVESH